ncbi:MAG: carboxypeptidase-like regulatory domain-containing protein, partial [Bacteroidota bacterium]|nr:carboxypeptidase-like regulatory domain-containing protein [Bacteroidota bacterium]
MSFSIYAAGISGYIIDCANNSPLVGVNIKVDGYGYGTISNNEGYFRLTISDSFKGKTLKISHIGYKSFDLKIAELADKTAKKYCMEEDLVALAEITVIPDNMLLSMLTKAYKKIPENYPDFSTRFQGFYREGLKMKDGPFLEFSEAIINGYKTSYSVKTMGQISIEKSRKNIFPGRDTINLVRFYGGPFFPHTYDIVHSRKEFIQPSNFKDYKYQVEEEVLYDGNPAYRIGFTPKKDNSGIAKGTFLLDKETLAYIRFDYQLTERGIKQKMMGFLGPLKQLSSKKIVAYYKYNNKWYINSIKSASEYKNTKSNNLLETTNDYITTSVEFDDVEPIPFEK